MVNSDLIKCFSLVNSDLFHWSIRTLSVVNSDLFHWSIRTLPVVNSENFYWSVRTLLVVGVSVEQEKERQARLYIKERHTGIAAKMLPTTT